MRISGENYVKVLLMYMFLHASMAYLQRIREIILKIREGAFTIFI